MDAYSCLIALQFSIPSQQFQTLFVTLASIAQMFICLWKFLLLVQDPIAKQ